MSMSTFLKSQKAFLLALDPLRQISTDLNNNDNDNNNEMYTKFTEIIVTI